MNRVLFISWAILLLTACAGSEPKYSDTPTVAVLEVPPDLTGIAVDDKASSTVSGSDSTARRNSRKNDPIVKLTKRLLPEINVVKVMRAGQHRWLVVDSKAESLWLAIRGFLIKLDLEVVVDNPETGIMETAWRETRPLQDEAGGSRLRQVWKKMHTTGKRDKFRFRLEHGLQPGTMEVYISHRLYEEVALTNNNADVMKTVWHPIAPDPVRETEMMRLLMIYLGNNPRESGSMIKNAKAPIELAKLSRNKKNQLELRLTDSFERGWRRLGLALDRIGFSVQDRDRTEHIYYIQFIETKLDKKKKGFFSRMFGGDKKKAKAYYQVKLAKEDNRSRVEVRNKNGKPENSVTGEQILKLLHEQLKY